MEFTFNSYRSALETASRTYHFSGSVRDYLSLDKKDAGAVLILRHDCERDLEKALEIAKVEASLGLSSTFFIRAHSEYYSLLQLREREIVRELLALGMEIGLHYEPYFIEADGGDFFTLLHQDIALLENILPGEKINTLSAHQPLRFPPPFEEFLKRGFIEVYIHPEIRKLKYYSDSGMKWREKSLAEAVNSGSSCQFLIHPDFWNHQAIDWFENHDLVRDRCITQIKDFAESEQEMLRNYLRNRESQDREFKKKIGNL